MFQFLITLALIVGACAAVTGMASASGYPFGDSAGKNQQCLSCHGDPQVVRDASLIDQVQFAHTTHARIGCQSCHGPLPKDHPRGAKMPRADCRECHLDISQQYAGSIHAGKTQCTGCHNPHKATSPEEISGQQITRVCSGCHERLLMTAKHSEWLPQAELHLRMLPCITCHTGSKNYSIIMYIVKGKNDSRFGRQELAGYDELRKLARGGDILSLVDTNGDNYISLQELRNFNRDPAHKFLRLQGMMTPDTVTHNFEILDSRRNCTFCHARGPAAMQTSFIAIPLKNGTFRRVAVEKGAVLDALYGTPDFYMMGSTKSATLNFFGLVIIGCGLIMPLGHGLLRFLTRKNRKEHES
jgi:predicted CXXCH cytochrome family protein